MVTSVVRTGLKIATKARSSGKRSCAMTVVLEIMAPNNTAKNSIVMDTPPIAGRAIGLSMLIDDSQASPGSSCYVPATTSREFQNDVLGRSGVFDPCRRLRTEMKDCNCR